MKNFVILCCIVLIKTHCFCQQNSLGNKCPCARIGLDSNWADSNKISCYLIPVSKNSLKPSNKKISLAVVVAPALNKSNEDPLLYLHGGPGIATLGNVPRYPAVGASISLCRSQKEI